MSESNDQPAPTIQKQHHIIIAHPPVKQEKSILDQITAFFSKEPTTTQTPKVEVTEKTIIQDVTPVIKQQAVEQSSWTSDFFSVKNREQWRKQWQDRVSKWRDMDVTLANNITKFKEQNLLSLGDIRIRSILMAFSAAVLYKVVSINTTGFLRKSRNLGLSFAFMGYWFVPQLFNPFLRKGKVVENII